MANNAVQLWLKIDNTNHHALTIPLDTCTRFANYPLTWLSYLGFAICGSDKGHISDTPNGQEIPNYRPDPVIRPGIYYYISQRESYFDASLEPSFNLCCCLEPRWVDVDMI